MNPQPLNELALWLPMSRDGLLTKAFNNGYPYMQGSIIMRSNFLKPVNRFVKNYVKDNKKFSLCLISLESDEGKMEAWLDDQAKKLKPEDIEGIFKMLGVKYE